VTAADTAALAAKVPATIGQLCVQLDTAVLWKSNTTTAGDWSRVVPYTLDQVVAGSGVVTTSNIIMQGRNIDLGKTSPGVGLEINVTNQVGISNPVLSFAIDESTNILTLSLLRSDGTTVTLPLGPFT
jgi:hypothetical protein